LKKNLDYERRLFYRLFHKKVNHELLDKLKSDIKDTYAGQTDLHFSMVEENKSSPSKTLGELHLL